MDDKNAAGAARRQRLDKSEDAAFVLLVNGETVLDRDRHRARRCLHRRQTFGDQRCIIHQAGTDAVVLHAVAGAADVQVDFLIAVGQRDFTGTRQRFRFAAAELQGAGGICRMMQVARYVAEDQGTARHHLAVQKSVAGKKAV